MAPTMLSNSLILANAIILDEKENEKLIKTIRTDHKLSIQPSNTSSKVKQISSSVISVKFHLIFFR